MLFIGLVALLITLLFAPSANASEICAPFSECPATWGTDKPYIINPPDPNLSYTTLPDDGSWLLGPSTTVLTVYDCGSAMIYGGTDVVCPPTSVTRYEVVTSGMTFMLDDVETVRILWEVFQSLDIEVRIRIVKEIVAFPDPIP